MGKQIIGVLRTRMSIQLSHDQDILVRWEVIQVIQGRA